MSEIKAVEAFSLEDIVKAVITILQSKETEEITEVELLETHLPKGSVKRYRSIEEYPPIMYVEDVKQYILTMLYNCKHESIKMTKCLKSRFAVGYNPHISVKYAHHMPTDQKCPLKP